MHLSVGWGLRLLFASFFPSIQWKQLFFHLTISSFHCLGCLMILKGTYGSTESQRILDLALMGLIRQLMSSMRAQRSLGKDKQSQSAESSSPDWPFPALFKTATLPSAAIEYHRDGSFCSLITFHTQLNVFYAKNDFKSQVLLLHQALTGRTVSHMQTELIHLIFFLFLFFAGWGPADERLIVSQINTCAVLEALAGQLETNPSIAASGLMLCVCESHGGPDTQIHSWSNHLQHLWSGILLKGTKPELGMEIPIFQTVADWLHLKEPRLKCSGREKKKFFLNCTQVKAEHYSCRLHFIMFVP